MREFVVTSKQGIEPAFMRLLGEASGVGSLLTTTDYCLLSTDYTFIIR